MTEQTPVLDFLLDFFEDHGVPYEPGFTGFMLGMNATRNNPAWAERWWQLARQEAIAVGQVGDFDSISVAADVLIENYPVGRVE